MTDIELRRQGAIVPDEPTPGTDLRVWAEQATAAAVYAERVCSTQMVPAAYRGKPAEACAAILAGAELGFGPMASLRAFHPINGTPAPAAITLRAVVQSKGHKVRIVESSATRAVVSGLRLGDDEWQTSIWDVDRASKLPQFKTNKNYEHNLGAMLVARATAEVCRWIGSDAIMGMPYAAEELDDQPAPVPAVRRLSVADLDEPAAIEGPAATFAEQRAAHEAAHPEQVTRDQQRHLFALWKELGKGGDENRAARLQGTADIVGLAKLASFNDLSFYQASEAITVLRERLDAAPAEVPGGAE